MPPLTNALKGEMLFFASFATTEKRRSSFGGCGVKCFTQRKKHQKKLWCPNDLECRTILVVSSSSMWPQFCLPPLPLFFPLGLFCCMPRGARFHPICIFPRTSSHFNWLKKCSRRHASPIISQRGYLCISKQLP